MPLTHPTILAFFAASVATGTLFLVVEGFWAREPIFPLRLLLNRDVVTSYVNLGFQTGAQGAVRPHIFHNTFTALLSKTLDDDARSNVFSSIPARFSHYSWRPPDAICHWKRNRWNFNRNYHSSVGIRFRDPTML